MNIEQARDVLRRNKYCFLATASPDAQPWVAPLFFNHDPGLNFYWEAAADARHSELLGRNRSVSIVVPDLEDRDGQLAVYLEAEAIEFPVDRLATCLPLFLHGPHELKKGSDRTE